MTERADAMAIQFESQGKAADEAAIAAVEAQLGIRFPEDYRRFLAEFNGAQPEGNVFDVPSMAEQSSVRVFYGATGDEYDDLVLNWKVFLGRMPANLIPIAEDDFGNLVVISVAGCNTGRVFFWDHDREAPQGETADYRNVHEVAQSFDAFLQQLRRFDPKSIPPGAKAELLWIDPGFLREQREKGNLR